MAVTDPAVDTPLRRLFRRAAFRRWAVANLFARLPLTMNLLALVLAGEAATGSLATGATLAGISTFSGGLTAQWRGRRLDRVELRGGLRRDLVAAAVGIGAVAIAVLVSAPFWVLAVLVAVQGVVAAAVLGGFRALLVPTVPPEDIEPANAVDAVFVEVAFMAGPAIAGALALFMGAVGVLALQALAFLTAAVLVTGLVERPPVLNPGASGPPPWRTRGATSIYLLIFFVGLPLGAFEAAIPARVEGLGWDPAAAGPLLALTALGSGVAGVVAANLRDPLRAGRITAAALLVGFSLAFLPVSFATTVPVLAVGLLLVGIPIAPMNALAGLAFQRILPLPRQAEGFALFPAMILIGAGVGQVLAGQALESISPSMLMRWLSAVPAVLALVVFGATLRRWLAGLPRGLGYQHDPLITDPAAYARQAALRKMLKDPAAGADS